MLFNKIMIIFNREFVHFLKNNSLIAKTKWGKISKLEKGNIFLRVIDKK